MARQPAGVDPDDPNQVYSDDLGSRVRLVAAAYVLLLRPAAAGTAAPGTADLGAGGTAVLLHLRQGTGYRDGHWALVAGHVDPGESVIDAAVREVREETGVVVAADDLEPVTTVHRTLRGGGPREQRADVFFATRRWSGEPRVMEPAKNAGLAWWPLTRVVAGLPEPCVPHELDVLRRVAGAEDGGRRVPAVLIAGF